MTIPMPEPVAEIVMFGGTLKEVSWRKGRMPKEGTTLITTTQAEAYANARVREALERAASLCDELADNDENSGEYAGCAAHSAARIRTLIPKEPT